MSNISDEWFKEYHDAGNNIIFSLSQIIIKLIYKSEFKKRK